MISILIPLLVGFVGSFFTSTSVYDWYPTLKKPPFNPPNWIFGPVWTTLYILIGISLYLVWSLDFGGKKWLAIGVFSLNLFLNMLWSFFFFGLKSPLFALIEIIILWIIILVNIIIFYGISKYAGFLLIPYLLWVTFATILNFSIYTLN